MFVDWFVRKTIILIFVIFIFSAFAKKNVLILNSYNRGLEWTDEITDGIWNVLHENVSDASIYIEYMDMLIAPQQNSNLKETKELNIKSAIINKYGSIKFDVVITVEYPAFNFAYLYSNELWENTPIVTTGITQKMSDLVDSSNSLWSGVFEFYDLPSQIDFINSLQKDVKRIIFLTNNEISEEFIKKYLGSYSVTNQKKIIIEELKESMLDSLSKILIELDPIQDAVVIAGKSLSYSVKYSSRYLDIVTKYVNEQSKAPVYSFWDVNVKNGVVGGRVVYANSMGQTTGLLAVAILEDPNYKPHFQVKTNIPIVDVLAAKKRNLDFDIEHLPSETRKINEGRFWRDTYLRYTSSLSGVIFAEALFVLIIFIIFYIYFKRLNRKLQEETKLTEKISRAKSLFLSNMSHELRTPLNAIIGFGNLLSTKNSNLNDEQKEWCKCIITSSLHLKDTLNNILDFSRMEAGNLLIEKEWVDIFDLCDELLSVCKHHIIYKSIRLYIIPYTNLPQKIKTDKIKLKQVLLNLLNNALKFTNKGYVKLIVKQVEENGVNMIDFEVIDTGIGIPKEKMAKIFEPFEQLDSGLTRKYEGAGLGLTISKNILKAMNSDLEVKSDVYGTSFKFKLNLQTRKNKYYKRLFNIPNQKIAFYNLDSELFDNVNQLVSYSGGILTPSTDIEYIMNLNEQDLLIAEADKLTIIQIQRISTKYSRVILLFYKENKKVEQINRSFPKYECLMAPLKNSDAIKALKKLYGSYNI